jgi:hypothetical protein
MKSYAATALHSFSSAAAAIAAASALKSTGTSQGVARHASLACRSISRIMATLFPEFEPGDGAGNLQRREIVGFFLGGGEGNGVKNISNE